MATKLRAAMSVTGPDGGGGWIDQGNSFNFPAISATKTMQNFPAEIAARVDTQLSGGIAQGDSLVPSSGYAGGLQPIFRLNGAQVVMSALTAALANLTLGVRVMRSIDFLGTGGLTAAMGALTSIPLGAPLSTSMNSGGTFAVTNAAGTTQLWTTSAAVPAGALAIAVNSQTPNGTYIGGVANALSPYARLTYQVGNAGAPTTTYAPVFGWVAPATGTPCFPASCSVVLPPITTNSAVVTPGVAGSYVLLFVGDSLEVIAVTSSSTAALPLGELDFFIA
jgi:hypothetical protein